jgi:hypothetical protein
MPSPAPNPTDTARILRLAAKLLRTQGWIQGNFARPTPDTPFPHCPLCPMGAIAVAACGRLTLVGEAMAAIVAVEDHLVLTVVNASLGYWNDRPGRSVTQVLGALEGTANRLEKAP